VDGVAENTSAKDRNTGDSRNKVDVAVTKTATPELSRYLERPVGSPLLLTTRTTFCRIRHEESPFEFVRVYFVPDKYKFEINLSRK
jgi:DNA-binding GntR family transcriptional regulator